MTDSALWISSRLVLILAMASVPFLKLWMASPTNLLDRSLVLLSKRLVLSSSSTLNEEVSTFWSGWL